MATVIDRVDRLEEALERFITSVGNSQMRTEAELREFKEENREQICEMNRQWGKLANKLGTLVEDLVYPSLPRIVAETLGRETLRGVPPTKQKLPDGRRVKAFDAMVVTADLIGLNSTRATLRSEDVDRFVEDIAAFRKFFPEYRELPVVGILATLAVDERAELCRKAGLSGAGGGR